MCYLMCSIIELILISRLISSRMFLSYIKAKWRKMKGPISNGQGVGSLVSPQLASTWCLELVEFLLFIRDARDIDP